MIFSATGLATLSSLVALKEDADLDIDSLNLLLTRVVHDISKSANRVRYTLNGFVIAAGVYVKAITENAMAAAKKIGTVEVDRNGTAYQIPNAIESILKIKAKGTLGKKKKTVKC